MKVGISVLTHEGQSIWENGIGQNVIYLAQLLSSLSFVDEVILLNCGNQSQMPVEVDLDALKLRLMTPRDATHLIDVAIELAGGLDVEWLDYIRAMGKKVVFHCCGQAYISIVEPIVFEKPGFFSRADRCDELWILQRDRRFIPMLQALHRCPVVDVPYLWSPQFIDRREAVLREAGVHFGYVPRTSGQTRPRALRVAIFEPNISVTKVCSIPMLVCDSAFRADPKSVAGLHVLNSVQMKDHPTFNYLANSLDIVKQSKAVFQQRHDFAGYMGQFADAVISHQWLNMQNTLYLDALHGGYPLIHNSPWLGNAGYYYPEFDIAAGAHQLLSAARNHDEEFDAYQERSKAFLARLHPDHAQNRDDYARRLLRLTASSGSEGRSC